MRQLVSIGDIADNLGKPVRVRAGLSALGLSEPRTIWIAERIATESVSLCVQMKSRRLFWNWETAICIYLLNLPAPSTEVNGEFVRANASCRDLEQAAGIVLRSVIELRCGSLEPTTRC